MARFTIYADNQEKGYPFQLEADDIFAVEKYSRADAKGIDMVKIGYYSKVKKEVICRDNVNSVNEFIEKYRTPVFEKPSPFFLPLCGFGGAVIGFLFGLMF